VVLVTLAEFGSAIEGTQTSALARLRTVSSATSQVTSRGQPDDPQSE
jgi:hypothetical protein